MGSQSRAIIHSSFDYDGSSIFHPSGLEYSEYLHNTLLYPDKFQSANFPLFLLYFLSVVAFNSVSLQSSLKEFPKSSIGENLSSLIASPSSKRRRVSEATSVLSPSSLIL